MSHREEGAKFLKETSSPRLDALTKILSLTKLESGYSEPSSQPDLNFGLQKFLQTLTEFLTTHGLVCSEDDPSPL